MKEEIDINEYNELDGFEWGFPDPIQSIIRIVVF